MTTEHNHDCSCGHDHDHDCNCGEENNKISLVLNDDSELICDVIGIFSLDEDAEQEYIALVPESDEDGEVLIYRYSEDENGLKLDNIDSDDEYEEVSEAFEELFLEDEEEDGEA